MQSSDTTCLPDPICRKIVLLALLLKETERLTACFPRLRDILDDWRTASAQDIMQVWQSWAICTHSTIRIHSRTHTWELKSLPPWSFQLEKTLNEVKQRGDKLQDSMLSYKQSLHFIKTVIIPAATYVFPLAYLTQTDLGKIDRIYARICKQALGLPKATPTSMIFEDREKGGASMTSLFKVYTKLTAESLVQALLNPGQLGIVLHLQHNTVDSVIDQTTAKTDLRKMHQYHLARKLAIIKQAGLSLTMPANDKSIESNLLQLMPCLQKHLSQAKLQAFATNSPTSGQVTRFMSLYRLPSSATLASECRCGTAF